MSSELGQALKPMLLHEFFEHSAERYPDAIAIDVPPGVGRPIRSSITYAELQRKSSALANQLSDSVNRESIVAILLSRDSEHIYVSQLAVLTAGAAYVCIDPNFPDESIREILEDARPALILTNRRGLERSQSAFPHHKVLDVQDLSGTGVDHDAHFLNRVQEFHNSHSSPSQPTDIRPELEISQTQTDLAYLIYTSGTTGRPKGVMISHQSISNLVASDLAEFNLTPNDRIAQGSSAAYDSSVEEIWLAFASGATLVVMDEDTDRLGPDLVLWLREERITVLCPPPTLLRSTGCDNPEKELPDLKLLYVGGEALPTDVADRWARGRRMVNGYGPTECTVTSLRADVLPGQPISIGKPITGLQAFVLDESLNEVSGESRGELCISGVGLANGYRNSPELTASKFPIHPRLGRIYRTGDLVHRDPDGSFYYHGRIDSQVKLRGYRIELEAIEACLVECEGVRQAACRVQGQGDMQTLVGFIVPTNPLSPPSFDELQEQLAKHLPDYMVPGHFGLIDALPRTVGGKVKRSDLPNLELHVHVANQSFIQPHDAMESKLAIAFGAVLGITDEISTDEDFFRNLGGSSLQAAQLISRLRNDPETASLTVRDLYETRTVSALALRLGRDHGKSASMPSFQSDQSEGVAISSARATLSQILWLCGELIVGSWILYLTMFRFTPWFVRLVDPVAAILLAPLLLVIAVALYAPITIMVLVAVKRLLIGRYEPQRAPVWGPFYVRNWMVMQVSQLVPWGLLAGTEFQNMALRCLGARIGDRVHIHRGVDLFHGGWDLLDIGDDVCIGQDATVRVIDLEDRHLVVGQVTLERGATMEVRSGLGPNTWMGENSYLCALSSLPMGGRIPKGERWDGVPAAPVGLAPAVAEVTAREMSPHGCAAASIALRLSLYALLALPLELFAVVCINRFGMDADSIMDLFFNANSSSLSLVVTVLLFLMPLPATVVLEAMATRALGKVSPGKISVRSLAYIRVWLKTTLVDSAGLWLSGTLLWPAWLRMAGMKVGPNCEISTIIDVVPELVDIGPDTFLADGIYLGGPTIHRGVATLENVSLSTNTFLGNHVVVAEGQHLPQDILLGVCTVANDRIVRAGSSWFGHPPFELPRREVVEFDRSLTHNPSAVRYVNRLLWELARFAVPIVPLIVFVGWLRGVSYVQTAYHSNFHAFGILSVTLVCAITPCIVVLMLKWVLIGRVKPGTHALWSCWCSRWDFLYVAWGVYSRGLLVALEGTQMLTWYLRAVGMKLGKNVVLGEGFSQVVDPDMLEIEDGATVCAMFQAHTFEDRVLKIDKVHVGKNASLGSGVVPLYGAQIGEGTKVGPHSVIMKHERLLPNRYYEGTPTKPQESA